jgi:hypothetical protein
MVHLGLLCLWHGLGIKQVLETEIWPAAGQILRAGRVMDPPATGLTEW